MHTKWKPHDENQEEDPGTQDRPFENQDETTMAIPTQQPNPIIKEKLIKYINGQFKHILAISRQANPKVNEQIIHLNHKYIINYEHE
jgi:hypothetical protein